jgi:hypothetical protein
VAAAAPAAACRAAAAVGGVGGLEEGEGLGSQLLGKCDELLEHGPARR